MGKTASLDSKNKKGKKRQARETNWEMLMVDQRNNTTNGTSVFREKTCKG